MPFCCQVAKEVSPCTLQEEEDDSETETTSISTNRISHKAVTSDSLWLGYLRHVSVCDMDGEESDNDMYFAEVRTRSANDPGHQSQRNAPVAQSMVASMQESFVMSHSIARGKGTETIRLLVNAVKRDHLCAALSDVDIMQIVNAMQFFQFQAGEAIVQQGSPGIFFFAAHSGRLEIIIDGKLVSTIGAGTSFGSIALVFDCPRAATVRAATCAGVWGCHGRNFRRFVLQNSQQHLQETRKFIDSIKMFDGLKPQMKDRLSRAFVKEFYGAGDDVVQQGHTGRTMYVIKKGQMHVIADGILMSVIGPGDVFGEQALLYDMKRSATVKVVSPAEVLSISYSALQGALGEDVNTYLKRNFMLAGLQNSPVFKKFSPTQQLVVVDHMEIQHFGAHTVLPEVEFGLVATGSAVAQMRSIFGSVVQLLRGSWYAADELVEGAVELPVPDDRGTLVQAVLFMQQEQDQSQKGMGGLKNSGLGEVVAGDAGCTLAYLTASNLAAALTKLGMPDVGDDEVLDASRKMEVINDIYIFKSLSKKQLESLCHALVPQTYSQGANVIVQGEHGKSFHIVGKGELQVLKNGQRIRALGRNSYFGERALLLDEPRTATIQVTSPSAEVWCVKKEAFLEIVSGKTQEELIKRVNLHDTSVTLKDLQHVTLLGAGSFGVVRLVRHVRTGFEYALKRVRKQGGRAPPELLQECALMADLDDGFAVYLVKTFETARHVYILSELLTGGDLFAALQKQPTPLQPSAARFYLGAIVLGVEALHAKDVVYRDLKPQNCMLDGEGYPKLIDFGTAKKLRGQQTFTIVGTPYYMAPEILQNRGYGHEVDLWSLGVCMYELMCGKYPFGDGQGLNVIYEEAIAGAPPYPDSLDPASKELMDGLLQKRPEARLGAGLRGWDDVKSSSFFEEWELDMDYDDDASEFEDRSAAMRFFDKLRAHELPVPWMPSGKVGNPELLAMEGQLSDKFELA